MDEIAHIQLLSDQVANKIAAGEVVDRPASVMKELVENALDALATRVEVEVTSGGRKAVVVTDNGHGMGRDDALLAVERHATSKIRDVDDIERIATMGFRGEALAAIASVSRFTLTTRRQDMLSGTEISIAGGRMVDVKEVGCPPGTGIAVRNLFFNVPARRKFLRAEQTELSHIRQMFLTYALAHPHIAFRLVVDGREAYRLAGGASLTDRLRELFDAELVKSLQPIELESSGARVTGYAGVPSSHRGDRSGQYVFINKRPASAPLIGYALREGYDTLLPKGRHPVVFLFVDIEPDLVDVNVHPTKKEVRFRRPGDLRDAIIAALRKALSTSSAATGLNTSAMPPDAPPAIPRESAVQIEGMPLVRSFQYPRLPVISEGSLPGLAETDSGETPTVGATLGQSPWSWCRVLGQIGGLYVVMETEDGMVLMDPHAAHERVLFERLMGEVEKGQVSVQGLLAPENIELPPKDAQCVRKHIELLRKIGFGISEFGGDTFLVDALPSCLGGVAPATVLLEMAQSAEQGGAQGASRKWTAEAVIRASCRSAVHARDKLKLEEIERLVVDLARTDMPYTCPHGRPTLIFTSTRELGRKFGRS